MLKELKNASELPIKLPMLSKEASKDLTISMVNEIKVWMEKLEASKTDIKVPDLITALTDNIVICYELRNSDDMDFYSGYAQKRWLYFNAGLNKLLVKLGISYDGKYPSWDKYDRYALFTDTSFGLQIQTLLPKKLTGMERIGKREDVSKYLYLKANQYANVLNKNNASEIEDHKVKAKEASKNREQQRVDQQRVALDALVDLLGSGKAVMKGYQTSNDDMILNEPKVGINFKYPDGANVPEVGMQLTVGVSNASRKSVKDVVNLDVTLFLLNRSVNGYFSSKVQLTAEQKNIVKNYVTTGIDDPDFWKSLAKEIAKNNLDNPIVQGMSDKDRDRSYANWHPEVTVHSISLLVK